MQTNPTAKEILDKYLAAHYDDAFRAKKEGKPVCWATAVIPQELMEVMDITTVYPENHAAACGARRLGPELLTVAENAGFSMDVCSYARINIAYTDKQELPTGNMPQPDLLFCCANSCHVVIKWYENLSRKLNIPLILIDTPFNLGDSPTKQSVTYVKKQIQSAITKLEGITGRKFDYDKFHEVMKVSNEVAQWWEKGYSMTKIKPSPLNGFEMFNYMALMLCARGKQATADLYKLWVKETEAKAEAGQGPWKDQEEKFRILWDGIICWPYIGDILKLLKKLGINLVASPYPRIWNIQYEPGNLDSMAAAYAGISLNNNLRGNTEPLLDMAREHKVDGIIYHSNRSCKPMSFKQLELERRMVQNLGLPTVFFDGDQTDPRLFSPAQFETRIQALCEMMEGGK